jgi:hypothetical protein
VDSLAGRMADVLRGEDRLSVAVRHVVVFVLSVPRGYPFGMHYFPDAAPRLHALRPIRRDIRQRSCCGVRKLAFAVVYRPATIMTLSVSTELLVEELCVAGGASG